MAFVGAGFAFVVLYFLFRNELSLLQEKYNLFSIGDYFGIKYGIFSKKFVNIILTVSLFLFLILQIFVNTNLFSTLLGSGKLISLVVTTGIVCLYLWFGGFNTSIKTDIFQGILMLPIILTIFFFPFSFTLEKIPSAFDLSQFWFAVGLAFLQFLSLLAQPESFQRIFAVKNSKILKKSLVYSFLMLILVAGSIAYLGINFKFAGIIMDPSNLFVEGVLGVVPQWLGSFLVISLIAAFMGAIDSSAFALGVLFSRSRDTASAYAVKQTRLFTVGSIVVAAFASWYLFSFLSAVFALISLISIVGMALLISLIFEVTEKEIIIFLVSGVVVYSLGLLMNFITNNPLTSLIPSVAGLIIFLIIHFYVKYEILFKN